MVLAADRAGDPEVLTACADLADRRLRFELRDSPAKLVGWVQHQCSADWILRLDDDEIPSPALLRALPGLMADRRVSEVAFHRRWLYGSADRWIDAPPWRLDYQARLLRNVPGLWTFEGRVHTVGVAGGERRMVPEPMYHADLVLTSLEARRRKSVRYEAEDPGAVWDDFPVNAMYVPQQLGELATEAVPDEDRESGLRLVLAAAEAAPAPAAESANDTRGRLLRGEPFQQHPRPSEAALRGAVIG